MIGTADQDAFVRRNRWGVVTTLRRDGSPSNSVIFYMLDGDTLVFSTTNDRLKAKSVRNDNRVAVTALDEGEPFGYVTIEGTADIQEQDLVDGHVRLNRAMRNNPDWQPPEGFAERLESQGRVLIRVNPERVHGVTNRG